MLGMHGTVAANFAVDRADLLLAIGVRFDDRVTGKLESFAARARIVHVDIDPAEINKNKASHVTVCADAKPSLKVGTLALPWLKCIMCWKCLACCLPESIFCLADRAILCAHPPWERHRSTRSTHLKTCSPRESKLLFQYLTLAASSICTL